MSAFSQNYSPVELLSQLPLLSDLPEDELNLLAEHTLFSTYADNEVIFYQDDKSTKVFIVYQGRAKIVFHDRDGREVILEMISAGEAFGGAVLFFPTHPATAMAMGEAVIANFSADIYNQVLLRNPQTMLKLLRMLGLRQRAMINMQIMAGERVERRMAHILYKLATRLGRKTDEGTLITISLSRQDLADMACTTLETSIRTISRFQKDGLMTTKRGGFVLIKDLVRLKDLTGQF